jgi:hypothetical protein
MAFAIGIGDEDADECQPWGYHCDGAIMKYLLLV